MLKQNISCLIEFTRFITRGSSTHAKSYCLVCIFNHSCCKLFYKTKTYFKLYQGTIYIRSAGFNHLIRYLVIMNRAGGLYGRILTEVVSTDRTL